MDWQTLAIWFGAMILIFLIIVGLYFEIKRKQKGGESHAGSPDTTKQF